ncbi:MAG: FtsX-like permease family protein [Thermoplasmata archaeon]|nr:FtsX-like permease family protein [Thermoplasmata archaeon]
MVDSTLVVGALILAVVGVIALVFALGHRLALRIALRNVRRGRARTVLLILGLLVGTTIISGSLIVGSTVQALSVHYTYLGGGYVDESIYALSPTGGYAPFSVAASHDVALAAQGHPGIAGVTPMIIATTQAYDHTTGIPETALNLIASNSSESGNLGSFMSTSGGMLSGPSAGQVFLDDQTAQALGASVGDSLELYGPTPIGVTVSAIVQENLRGGYLTAGLAPGNVFLDLPTAQTLENLSGHVNFIAITNAGSQQDGIALSDTVSGYLNTTLATIPLAAGLTVHEPLKDGIAAADVSGSSIQTIFLVLGLFSIVAGAMLIVGIFVMLAEERKGEMGMLRAVGMRRRELVFVYYFEGLVYAVGSALAGTLLGVLVGYFLTYTFSLLFSSGGLTSAAILQSFNVSTDDLVISYVTGFLLTVVTVAIASSRVSRLNIVQAIRDLPSPPPPVRLYTTLGYVGVALTIVGALVLLPNAQGTSDISLPILGGGMMILGLGLIASRFVRNRIAFSLVGVALLVWAGAEPLHRVVLGQAHTGGIFIVFVEGILMVSGALLLYVFNSNTLIAALLRVAGRGARGAPIARVGLAYPGRRPARTAINLTIFALVTFTMVAIACFGATVQANLNNTIQSETGGYTYFGVSTQPIPTLPEQVANNPTLNGEYAVTVPLISGAIQVNITGSTPNPYTDSLYSAPGNQSSTSSFYATSQFPFTATWEGWSPSAVLAELASNRSVALVDQNYAPATSSVGGGPSAPHPSIEVGGLMELTPPGSSNHLTVRVIGILSQSVLTGVWINPGAAETLGYSNETAFLLTLRSGVSTTLASQDAKREFFRDGLVLFEIAQILETSIASTEGIIGLLEIFVGLGLGVGIAAMGILALRAVVERRREIGMLRAMGFTQRAILKTFFIEYSFITLLGLGIGTSLGILIVYNLSTSPSAAASGVSFFAIPVLNIVLILVVAYGLAMLAIAVPSIRASRIPPAEAVRATE